jgi:hypothetical protein
MSAQPVASAITALREAAARVAWTQWGAIFTFAASSRPARAIVDPEALVLGSFALSGHEPRLWRVARLWARFAARLLSVQRMKNLARRFPTSVNDRLSEFAQVAVAPGGDQRWRSIARASPPTKSADRRERDATPVLEGGAPLMLRLRLGFGVGIKADVVSYLIGLAGARSTVQQIALATAYYGRAVRRALEELVAAGFVEARPTAPASYRVDLAKWADLLAITSDDPPAWRPWASVYAFVAALDAWSRRPAPESQFVLASEARDLVAQHAEALESAGVRLPALSSHRGEAYLEPFRSGLKELGEFIDTTV